VSPNRTPTSVIAQPAKGATGEQRIGVQDTSSASIPLPHSHIRATVFRQGGRRGSRRWSAKAGNPGSHDGSVWQRTGISPLMQCNNTLSLTGL